MSWEFHPGLYANRVDGLGSDWLFQMQNALPVSTPEVVKANVTIKMHMLDKTLTAQHLAERPRNSDLVRKSW